jgi:predicted  nucleic acid-binding Zn-ribbon protein
MELFEAEEELKSVNSQLTLFMKKKKALQDFIQEENERLERLDNPITKIWKLKKDKEFLATYGRERTAREIGILVGYSERQVQRYLAKKKD